MRTIWTASTCTSSPRVRSRVEIHAECDSQGRTQFTRLWSEGALGVRKTGDAHVHLVGTAAGPIGADSIQIIIKVGAGARLSVEGVAATIALPGNTPGVGSLEQWIQVDEAAQLQLALPALIVTADSDVHSRTEVVAAASAELVLIEQVSLGRHEEAGGRWTGRMLADVAGRPVLRQTQTSDSIHAALARDPFDSFSGGAIVSRLVLGPAPCAVPLVNTQGNAMVAILESGGTLQTSVGATLARAHHDLCELEHLNAVELAAGLAPKLPPVPR